MLCSVLKGPQSTVHSLHKHLRGFRSEERSGAEQSLGERFTTSLSSLSLISPVAVHESNDGRLRLIACLISYLSFNNALKQGASTQRIAQVQRQQGEAASKTTAFCRFDYSLLSALKY